jgi:hypothetical protein
MERLRGSSEPEPGDSAAPASIPTLTDKPVLSDSPTVSNDIPQTAPVERLNPTEYRPRNPAPESKRDLGALRELANSSARSALVRHTTKTGGKTAVGKSLWAAAALLSAVSFFHLQLALGPIAVAGTAISLVAFLLWGSQAAGSMKRILQARRLPSKTATARSDSTNDSTEETRSCDKQGSVQDDVVLSN